MKKILPGLLIVVALFCLGMAAHAAIRMAAWNVYSYKPFKPTVQVAQAGGPVPGDASIICFSLLEDYSTDPVMKGKVREVIADGDFSDGDCHTLIKFNDDVKAEEERQKKIKYFQDAKENIKS